MHCEAPFDNNRACPWGCGTPFWISSPVVSPSCLGMPLSLPARPPCSLDKEAAAMHNRALDMQRRVEALRASKPVQVGAAPGNLARALNPFARWRGAFLSFPSKCFTSV